MVTEEGIFRSVRLVVMIGLIVAIPFGITAWLMSFLASGDDPGIIELGKWGSPLAVICGVVVLWAIKPVKMANLAPDFLKEKCGEYLEEGGMCVWPMAIVVDGVMNFRVYYQNRYDQHCEAVFNMSPLKSIKSKSQLDEVSLNFNVGSGEYGYVSAPYALDSDFWGTTAIYKVSMKVKYPQGRGKMLRFTEGTKIGREKFFGISFRSHDCLINIDLPDHAREVVPETARFKQKTLDGEMAPTVGFEVIPLASKAESSEAGER